MRITPSGAAMPLGSIAREAEARRCRWLGDARPLRRAARASIPRRPSSALSLARDSWRWALSSAVEHYLDMVGVRGSIPLAPTIFRLKINNLHIASRECVLLSRFGVSPGCQEA